MIPEQARLDALRALNILDTPPEERFDRITRLVQRTFGVPMVAITLIDEKRAWFKSRVGLEETEMPRTGSFCEATLLSQGLLIVPDARKDPRFSGHPLVVLAPKIRFYAGHPIEAPDGSVVGTLSLLDRVPRDLDMEQRRALRDLAGMIEQQLAALPEAARPHDEHFRVLARLRGTPEHRAGRRNLRAAFFAIAVLLVLATGISLRLAFRLTSDASAIEAALASGAPSAAGDVAASFERLRSTAHFFRVAVGVRGLIGLALLLIVLVLFDRHLEARLATLAAVDLDRGRLQSVIDAIGDGVVVADARGRFTLFNPAAERILGLGMVDDPDETNHFYLSFFYDGGAPCPPEKHPLARAIAGESTRGDRLIVRNDRRPGGVPVSVTATPVHSFDGTPAGGVIIFRDAA